MNDDLVPEIDLRATLSQEAWKDARTKAWADSNELTALNKEAREPAREQIAETIKT